MLLEIGTVGRAHGLKGQVVVDLTTNRTERVAVGSRLHAGDRELEVVASVIAPAGARGDRWLVSFRGVTTREAAEALRGAVLRAEPLDEPGVLWVHELIGSRVVDVNGAEHGTVTDVQANPASDLLVLDGGALVPLRFVVAAGDGTVTVDVPPGLFE